MQLDLEEHQTFWNYQVNLFTWRLKKTSGIHYAMSNRLGYKTILQASTKSRGVIALRVC